MKNIDQGINQKTHDEQIVAQFTKQAIPFTQLSGHLDSIQMLIEMSQVGANDCVLDVACGPGLVACAFAQVARHVTGIDITEKMIEQAQVRQAQLNLNNMSWDVGTAYPLPYESDFFDVVITRYSFHHFIEPHKALEEMIRVCKPNGVVLIADAALPASKVNAYNRMEKLRDPSHTQALSTEQWQTLMQASGLKHLRQSAYQVEMELEKQLRSSFPEAGDDVTIRGIFKADLGVDNLGMGAHLKNGDIHFSYPIAVFVGVK